MTEPFRRWPLFASLIAYFVLTAALIAAVPLFKSPDEAAHWTYVEHLATVGSLPVFPALPPPDPGYEFHQPPLYYLICAPLWKLLGAGVENYACRVVSMLCGLATIWVIWAAGRLVFPSNWRIAGVAAGFAALLPLHQAIGAGANNDGLAGLVCAVLFFLTARLWIHGPTWRDVWQLGLVAGLGILTKNTTLSVIAASFIVLLRATSRSEDEKAPRPIMAFGAAFAIAMIIGGPILLRNQTLYGDVLVQKAFKIAFQDASMGMAWFAAHGLSPLGYIGKLCFVIFCTLWGFFGGPNSVLEATQLLPYGPTLPHPWLFLPMLLCGLAPVVSILGWRILRAEEGLTESARAARNSWLLGIIFVALAWAQFAVQYFAGGQARYGHPALLPLCIFLAAGWVGFWGRSRALVTATAFFAFVLVTLTLLNVFTWKTLV